jgi:hypothetical protein
MRCHSVCSSQLLQSKVSYGLGLARGSVESNDDRNIPVDIVEAGKYVKYFDDGL